MTDGLNRVTLLGNLGADPELRTTSGGQSVLKLRLATTESYQDRNKQRQERTDWHSIVVWGKRGDALSRILQKGTRILVEGSIHTSSYDDKDGNKRYKTEINASNVVLCGSGQRDAAQIEDAQTQSAVQSGGYSEGDYGGNNGGKDDDFPF